LEVLKSCGEGLSDLVLGGVAATMMWLVDGRDLVRPMSISDVLAALQLACDPEVFPIETGFIQAIGNALSHQVLVVVSWVAVDVPVANLDRP
jgi:hypothetical protein